MSKVRTLPYGRLYPSRQLLSPRVSAFLAYLAKLSPQGHPEELAVFLD
ncbi:hypothetical protein [Sphingomonas kyeonggiensis]|uniref:Uncharacterized protein n=1 Tax=Sphingomonas kyeonggiensis TaxID=1268553 RepID=A0A7W6JTR2_9SPHN|nr:hypothetical protein [Sphingomonas kyeonggiensis]MBB4099418.1 hypothetical protein [Sphingomonas kyeonggiensis]MDQ0252424.1 hypothetical protein [Sphingomonas kyeonggiensis]